LTEAIERSAWWQTFAHLRKCPHVGTLGSHLTPLCSWSARVCTKE
jgi:hypothetical protein